MGELYFCLSSATILWYNIKFITKGTCVPHHHSWLFLHEAQTECYGVFEHELNLFCYFFVRSLLRQQISYAITKNAMPQAQSPLNTCAGALTPSSLRWRGKLHEIMRF